MSTHTSKEVLKIKMPLQTPPILVEVNDEKFVSAGVLTEISEMIGKMI